MSQSVALLRRKISQGYAGAEDEGENVAKEWHAKHKRMPQCQFMPESKVLWVWDGVQTTLLMYIAFVMPVRLAFDMETVEHGFYWWLDIFLDVFFLCDVVKNFRVAFYDSTTGELVRRDRTEEMMQHCLVHLPSHLFGSAAGHIEPQDRARLCTRLDAL